MAAQDVMADLDAPTDRPVETVDVRQSPPPEPLTRTLEALPSLSEETVLLQYNDRVPKHLFPKLEERGYDHDHAELDDRVVTAIWKS
jgi:uncharacterized protein (DUF2249 family)